MNKILKGSVVLAVGLLVTKVIGALYRIPLTNFLGSAGLGIYQTVFPFYSMLLTISSLGIPSALSKLIAEGANPEKVLYRSIIAFGMVGLMLSAVTVFIAKPLSALQGSPSAARAFICIAPSVCIVSVLSSFRGYFQGKSRMAPTALTQITEQLVKLISGITLVYFFAKTPEQGAFIATASITLSELAALAVIMVIYKKQHPKHPKNPKQNAEAIKNSCDLSVSADLSVVPFKKLYSAVFPLVLMSVMLPLCRLADSLTAINIMSSYTDAAGELYGIYTGAVETVIGVPVALCYGVAVSGMPVISADKRGRAAAKVLLYTLLLSVSGAVATYFLSDFAVDLLFFSFSEYEKSVTKGLIKISSVSVVLLSLLQSSNSVLYAADRPYRPVFSMFCGLIVKILLTVTLVFIPSVNIYGMAFSDIGCYFVAGFLNLLYIIRVNNENKGVIRCEILDPSGIYGGKRQHEPYAYRTWRYKGRYLGRGVK